MNILTLLPNDVLNQQHIRLRIAQEAHHFAPLYEQIKTAVTLKQEGHLIYAEHPESATSLVLYLLGLTQLNPLTFNLPFYPPYTSTNGGNTIPFQCDEQALLKASSVGFNGSRFLTCLYILKSNLQFGRTYLSVEESDNVLPFIQTLPENEDTCAQSYFLQQIRPELYLCKAENFESLVSFIHKAYLQRYPTQENNPLLLVTIYKELLQTFWNWIYKGVLRGFF